MDGTVVIESHVSGIKCDTRGCGWRDDEVRFEDYPQWVNRRCPRCGGNLLTEADMATCLRVKRSVDQINVLCNRWLPSWLLRRLDARRAKAPTFHADMNGTGKIKFVRQK